MSRRREREPERVWVVPPPPDLECSVCTEVFTDPVSLFCGHTFCRQCAVRWFAVAGKLCPAARCPASAESKPEQLPAAYVIKGVVDSLRVYCRYGLREDEGRWTLDPTGCPAHLLREEAAAHEASCAHAFEVALAPPPPPPPTVRAEGYVFPSVKQRLYNAKRAVVEAVNELHNTNAELEYGTAVLHLAYAAKDEALKKRVRLALYPALRAVLSAEERLEAADGLSDAMHGGKRSRSSCSDRARKRRRLDRRFAAAADNAERASVSWCRTPRCPPAAA